MKKILLSILVVPFSVALMAQSLNNLPSTVPFHKMPAIHPNPIPAGRTSTCGNDTILYSAIKENILGGGNYGLIPLYAGNVTQFSQAFLNSSSMTIHGISFVAGVADAINPAQTVIANIELYDVNAGLLPTTLLATKNFLLDTAINLYTAMFTTPVTVSGNFAVVVKNPSLTDTMAILINSAQIGGYDEMLSSIYFQPTASWYLSSGVWPGLPNAAYEPIIAPVITYNFTTDFIVSANDTVCAGTPIDFLNTTDPASIIENRMYNYRGFNFYWGIDPNDSTFVWDMGDGGSMIWAHDVFAHVYPSGINPVTLYTLGGLLTYCPDMQTVMVVNETAATAGFTSNLAGAPTVAFTNTSTGATSYSWDFGDSSPLDNSMNPSHTYAGGTFNVTLSATNSCGTVTNVQTIIVSGVGVNALNINAISVYPNPSTGVINIEGINLKSLVEVENLLGEVIYKSEISENTKTIDLSVLSNGVYSLKIKNEKNNFVKQIVINN